MVDWKYLTREIFDGGYRKYGGYREDGSGPRTGGGPVLGTKLH